MKKGTLRKKPGINLLQKAVLFLLGLCSRAISAQTCFSEGKFPKITDGISGDSLSFSMVGSDTLNAVFQGGTMEITGPAGLDRAAFVTKVSLENNMVQWRRLFDVVGDIESRMNMVSAMAISPDGAKLAVVGTVYAQHYSHKTWIWIISTEDGRYLSETSMMKLGNVG